MAGTGGKEVGKVTIRVVPDLDSFRERLKAELEKLERNPREIKVNADVSGFRRDVERAAKDLAAKVDVDADTAGIREDIRRATKGLGAEVDVDADTDDVERSLDRFKTRYLNKFNKLIGEVEANIPLTLDGEQVRKEIKTQEKEFRELLKGITPKLDPQTLSDLRRDVDVFYRYVYNRSRDAELLNIDSADRVKRAMKSIKEFTDTDIKLLLDYEAFDKELQRVRAESERTFADLDAALSIRVEDGEIKKIRRSLAERVVVPVKIKADFDRGGFLRDVAIASAATRQVTTAVAAPFRLLTAFPGILAKGFARLGPEVVALTALIAAILPPVIALIAGATTLAPALLAAFVPIGAIALGVEGIKRAAEAAKPAFDDLRQSIANTFEFGLPGQQSMTAGFKALAEQVIPNVKASLQNVAQSLNNQFNAVVGVLASPKGIDNLNNIFNNVAQGLDNAKAGLKGFTSGLLELISAISNKFPGLGTWFSQLGEKFAGWVEKFTTIKDGNGLTGLERTIQNVRIGIEGLTGVFQAFFSQGLKDIQNPDFGAGMKNFFDSVKSFVTNTLPALSEGFLEITNLLKQMEPLFNLIGGASNLAQLFVNPGQAISDAVSRFKKGGVKEALFGVGKGEDNPFQNLPNQASQAAAESKKALQEGLVLKGSFGGTGDVAKNATNQVVENVKKQTSAQVSAAITEAQSAVQALGPVLQSSIDAATAPLDTLPTKLSASFAVLGAAVGGAWDAVAAIITERTAAISTAITTSFESIPTRLMGSFAMLGAAVGGAMAGLRGVIASSLGGITDAFGQAFAGAAGRVASALSAVPGAVAAALSPTIGVVQQVMQGVLNLISTTGAQVAALASASFAQFPPAVQAAMTPAITAVSSICEQMVSTALSFAGAMEAAGRSIGASFAAGIASSEGLVSSAVSALMQAARNFIPSSPAKEGPFSGSGWVDKSGKSVGEAFAGGIQDSVGGVVNIARVLMQQVRDVFGNAEGVVFNFNFNGVNNGLDRTATSLGAVQTQFGSINTQAQELQTNLGAAALPPGLVGPEAKAQSAQLKQQLEELEIARKTLELQKVPGGDNTAIKAQLEQIRLRKLELGLQKNQLDYANKYGSAQNGITDAYGQQIQDLAGMPMDFGKAVSGQFMSDLGFGNGAIPTIANQLMDWGSQIVFNVSNMDDALQGQKRFQNQQSAAMIGR